MNEQKTGQVAIRSAVIGGLAASVFLLSTLALIGALSWPTKRTLQVQRIVLVNEAGQECGAIGTRPDGSSYIHLGDASGYLADKGTHFWVEASPFTKPDGGQVRMCIGSAERGSMRLTSGPYGNAGPLIYMSNAQGKTALSTGVWGKDGEGYFRIDDHDPNQAGVRSTKGSGNKIEGASLMVVDNEGQVLWSAPEQHSP